MGQSPIARIYLTKRAGKLITVISGLHTHGEDRMKAIAKELKCALGAGGTVKNGLIEIQGDKVVPVKDFFKEPHDRL